MNNSTFILASDRTERRDPLNDFKDYTGGWNISNRHYWAVRFPTTSFRPFLHLSYHFTVAFIYVLNSICSLLASLPLLSLALPLCGSWSLDWFWSLALSVIVAAIVLYTPILPQLMQSLSYFSSSSPWLQCMKFSSIFQFGIWIAFIFYSSWLGWYWLVCIFFTCIQYWLCSSVLWTAKISQQQLGYIGLCC